MARKSKTPKQPGFTADSTRYCDDCKREVVIGFGGEKNWDIHTASASHQRAIRETAALPKKTLLSFFGKIGTSSTAASVSSPGVIAAAPLVAPPTVLAVNVAVNVTAPHVTPPSTLMAQSQSSIVALPPILHELSRTVESLPDTVPLGLPADPLGALSFPPKEFILDDQDAWEDVVNPTLNCVLGFGITPDAVRALVRRGPYGMDGAYRYFQSCVRDLGIDAGLLEGKIERLLTAMVELGAKRDGPILADVTRTEPAEPIIIPDSPPPPPPCRSSPSVQFVQSPPVFARQAPEVEPPCPGYHLKLPEGVSPFVSYPFLLHNRYSLPWKVIVDAERLLLYSTRCSGVGRTSSKGKEIKSLSCHNCTRLHDNTTIMGIRHRLLDGTHESTPWAFFTPAEMYMALQRKTRLVRNLKLRALNNAVSIGVCNRHIQTWKRLSMAIGNSDIPRLRALMSTQIRAGASVYSILEKVNKAAARQYSPKGYTQADFERAFLIYKLGGRSAANIAQQALGVPSIDTTKRHIATAPLQPSPSFPTKQQLSSNLKQCYPLMNVQPDQPILGMSIQYDELKVQERLRWDPRTNHILGVCREHSKTSALEFRSMIQADAVAEALRNERVHLATEVTVIGSSILCGEPQKYVTKPYGMSGSCKRETVADQEKLITTSIVALKDNTNDLKTTLYCICSDGDSRRRRAFINIAMKRDLNPDDTIYTTLSGLPLFNFKCGDDALTVDFDWKHVLKRFRNTAIRQKGFSLNGVSVSTSVLREHLKSLEMMDLAIDSLLSPNDKQDVVLMIKLLHAISELASAPPNASPLTRSTREMLRLLGRVYGNLLSAYLDVSLSLDAQLVKLSTAAHLIFTLYNVDKGNFIPVQSYFDVMCMIKNVYFCVAKAQRDNPNGRFYIILLGTDGLEKVFGKVRTMVGNDTNTDVLQLANRIDGAVKCVNILELHPEWGGNARRLKVKPLNARELEITSKYDHLNPAAFTGDLRANSVILLGSWNEGRWLAEEDLRSFGIDPPFERMEKEGDYDMLCPFGKGKVVLMGEELESGERHETEEERDDPLVVNTTSAQPPGLSEDDMLQLDLDDLATADDVSTNLAEKAPSAYVPINANDPEAKPIHKSSVLRLYSSPLTINESRDRLKRVRGYSRYNEVKSELIQATAPGEEADDTLQVQDPAFVLVQCDSNIFLAVFQVLGIRCDGREVSSIPPCFLAEPSTRIHGQVMKLCPILFPTENHGVGPDDADWEWNGNFEATGILRDLYGRYIEQVDPQLQRASRGRNKGEDTYVFKTSELRAIAALMYERLAKESLPRIGLTDSFPYRTDNGDACFICEKDDVQGDRHRVDGSLTCPRCPNVKVEAMNGQDLLKHMGVHILNDPMLRGADSPCGLCLNTGNLCEIFLVYRNGVISVDQAKSHCPNICTFHVRRAEEFTVKQPCTNHPLLCPLCPQGASAIWKYNLKSHIIAKHPLSNPTLHEHKWRLHQNTAMRKLRISEGHSSRLALRTLTADGLDPVLENEEDTLLEDEDTYYEGTHSQNEEDIRTFDEEPPLSPSVPNIVPSSPRADNAVREGSPGVGELFDQWEPPTRIASPAAGGMANEDNSETTQARLLDDTGTVDGSRRRQKRKHDLDLDGDNPTDDNMCQDDGCGRLVTDTDVLCCKGPGCSGLYHLTCRGLSKIPTKDWYCDADCKANAMGTTGRKRRRKKN